MASPKSQLLIIESSVENLIEEVEKRPALYKKSLKEYSDANMKKKLWEEVCEAVVVDWNSLSAEEKTNKGRDVQKKWANLRTCYRRELNAQKNTKSGQAANKRRKYVYFEQLLFLLPCMENRLTEGNLEEENFLSNDEHDDQAGSSTPTPIRQRKKRPNVPKQTDVDEALLKALNEPNTDEDVNFALSLVPSLQSLTAEEKLDAKISILNVFKQIRSARCAQSPPTCTYNRVQQPLYSFPISQPTTIRNISSPGNSNDTAQSYYSNFSDESQIYDL
ncbi:uncharacterized protein LOC130902880 [Diorhabda carinulata]|uniref:uncharacterized protein LOC130897616 n=1 Tax=Diorhabda carinulata TaxID=1163345 RepID=UPI0025A0CCAE|nr:uncharacterized protein LOC130897616 [Diorhabda carinulata]XP_057671144.1 uncharacterized protein LOC130902880 [Diorhabda carinulata]